MGIFRTPSQRDSISVALRKLLQRRQEGTQAVYKFATKGAGGLNIKDQVIKLRNSAFCVWEDASLWSPWTHSFQMHLGCLGPILFASPLYFLHSTSSSVITVVGGGGLWWIEVLGALLHTRRPDIANGRYISGLLRFHFTLEIDHLPRWHSSKESECR